MNKPQALISEETSGTSGEFVPTRDFDANQSLVTGHHHIGIKLRHEGGALIYNHATASLPGTESLFGFMPKILIHRFVITAILSARASISGALTYDSSSVTSSNAAVYKNGFKYRENSYREGESRTWDLVPEGGMALQVKPLSGTAAPTRLLIQAANLKSDDEVVLHIYFTFDGLINMVKDLN